MPEPGLLYVQSRPKDFFSEDAFNKWYSEFHIQDVIASGLSDLAVRYKNTNPEAAWPYLCIYRLPDITKVTDKSVTDKVPLKHDLIPDGKIWPEALDADMRTFTLTQKFDGQIPKTGARGQALRTVMIEPGNDADFDEWYRKQHLDMLSMVPGFRRSTRYQLSDQENKEGHPRFIAMHEYDTADFPVEAVKLVTGTEWSRKVLKEAKSFSGDVWEEIAATGDVESKF
jgi:hypothetical protein